MAGSEVLGQSYLSGYARPKEINQWLKEHETISNTELEQVCYSIESHTLQLVCKISAKSKGYYYIADMLCDRNMNIYAEMIFSFLICMQNIFK